MLSGLASSKSLLHRALLVQSYFPSLEIHGHSECEDVQHIRKCLEALRAGEDVLDCGEGGAPLRFIALRASRQKGTYQLKGSPRLLRRPQGGLLSLLKQLGVKAELNPSRGLYIESQGWHPPQKALKLEMHQSSQFASALFLNSWLLDFDLDIQVRGKMCSQSYWNMTYQMLQRMGMKIEERERAGSLKGLWGSGRRWRIRAGQCLQVFQWHGEVDMDNVFALGVGALLKGKSFHLKTLHREHLVASLQPSAQFVKCLETMGIPISVNEIGLYLPPPLQGSWHSLKPLKKDVGNCPDLFPLLAILCGLALGKSHLFGAPQLAYKESHRLQKVHELLILLGVKSERKKDGLVIWGQGKLSVPQPFEFDPDQDHRLAMACGVLKEAGVPLVLQNPHCVRKSFPDFWEKLKERNL